MTFSLSLSVSYPRSRRRNRFPYDPSLRNRYFFGPTKRSSSFFMAAAAAPGSLVYLRARWRRRRSEVWITICSPTNSDPVYKTLTLYHRHRRRRRCRLLCGSSSPRSLVYRLFRCLRALLHGGAFVRLYVRLSLRPFSESLRPPIPPTVQFFHS